MWFDIVKRRGSPKNRYNRRLLKRFLEFIPVGKEFTVQDIIQFWETGPGQEKYRAGHIPSPGQQKYRSEHIPTANSLGWLIRQNKIIKIVNEDQTHAKKIFVKTR